jgi:SNF2 family DNA or RNA helicase
MLNYVENSLKKPGNLVKFRGRRCVVQPSDDKEIILLKPLGGSDSETMAVFQPIMQEHDQIEDDHFEEPCVDDIDNFVTAKLLYDAARLSFRQVSGPFRCMGKLSFRPRSYQLVPLIMSLKQAITRLLIADDVGIGKTVEALLILRELLERGTVKNFAVLCPPHLCEQWQKELADKLDIDAEIIRSSTVAALERKIIGDDTQNVFNYYPYQVISIDFVKSGNKGAIFRDNAPDLIIVDEAHTCTRPKGGTDSQQQRFHLLKDLAAKEDQHMVFLTATPHSGKDEEFQSLLGLLDPEFENLDLANLTKYQKEKIARNFILRKRENIKKWLKEETPFPDRSTKELPYSLSKEYQDLYLDIQKFVKNISQDYVSNNKSRIKYFAALTLLRGVMSSPEAGHEMLQNRKNNAKEDTDEWDQIKDNPVIERLDDQSDIEQLELIEQSNLNSNEIKLLNELSSKIQNLKGPSKDFKIKKTIDQIKLWVENGQSPIIFCRFIKTAHYVAEQLKQHLPNNIDIRAITSELSDEERKEKIDDMSKSSRRVLVATDCLSEGINLQDKFNAVLHYDLPWNPNRLEQREGRVDRYGQLGWKDRNGNFQNNIEVRVLFGEDNPIDVVVLRVIIEKIQNIRKTSGVSIALAEDNRSVMDKVLKEVLLDPDKVKLQFSKVTQLKLDTNNELSELDDEFTNEIERAREKAENLRSIFAHETMRPEEIEKDLKEVDEAIGDVEILENFVVNASRLLGAQLSAVEGGYIFHKTNIDEWLGDSLGQGDKIHISFKSPTPYGFRYIGRNHCFVEHLCNRVIANSLDTSAKNKAARASVFRTDSVETQTTLIQFRVRNVIREVKRGNEMISEEMFLWGYRQGINGTEVLELDECKNLLNSVSPLDLSLERQKEIFSKELEYFKTLHPDFIKVVESRSNQLVEAHTRFAKFLGAKRFETVTPVLPPDILGVYVLVPNPRIN